MLVQVRMFRCSMLFRRGVRFMRMFVMLTRIMRIPVV